MELKNGDLVASFFGGTKERNPDCCIWVCRKAKGAKEWTAPKLAADGVFALNDPNAEIAGIDTACTPVKDTKGKLTVGKGEIADSVIILMTIEVVTIIAERLSQTVAIVEHGG